MTNIPKDETREYFTKDFIFLSMFSLTFRHITGRSKSSSCKGDACNRQYLLTIAGILALISVCLILHRWSANSPVKPNETYVNMSSVTVNNTCMDDFMSGIWSSRYYQYRKWHGPSAFSLNFQSKTSKITGNGSDDVGEYIVEGIYSTKTNRIGLTKTYRLGTGDLTQNLGHSVTIQVEWNSSKRLFEGKWFVRTSNYSGEGKFELKFEKSFADIE